MPGKKLIHRETHLFHGMSGALRRSLWLSGVFEGIARRHGQPSSPRQVLERSQRARRGREAREPGRQ